MTNSKTTPPTDLAPKSTGTESESEASKTPHQGDKLDAVVEPPTAKTREEAAKKVKEQGGVVQD